MSEKTNWLKLNHEIPKGWGKYVVLMAEACSASNELKLIARFQKIVRLIHDEKVSPLNLQPKGDE